MLFQKPLQYRQHSSLPTQFRDAIKISGQASKMYLPPNSRERTLFSLGKHKRLKSSNTIKGQSIQVLIT